MQNTERQKFEENWKSAFDGAEMTPNDRVWNSIELDLAGQESAAMKKRVVFYQRLAAATVLFALLSGVYAFYPRASQEQMATLKQNASKEDNSNNVEQSNREQKGNDVSGSESRVSGSESRNASSAASTNSKHETRIAKHETRNPQRETFTSGQTIIDNQVAIVAIEPETLNSSFEAPPSPTNLEGNQASEKSIVSPLLQTAPTVTTLEPQDEDAIVEPDKKKRARENNLWLALGGAGGSYTPNTPTTTVAGQSMSSFAGPAAVDPLNAPKKQPKVGSSYSVGMSVGKKFGRVVIQTGVNLNKQQVDYTSTYDTRTTSNTAKAASMDYLSESSLSYTNEYTVNSTMEIISIPVQAGYMIVDRRLGWQVNAGVSPDFFLRNILVDKTGQRERFTQSAGSDSPYRSVNWSGLFNTELSYRLGDHYRLSFVPGVRYSFNSILKDPADNGRPVILDIGFRFRYLFD